MWKVGCPTCRKITLIKRKDGVYQLTKNWFIEENIDKVMCVVSGSENPKFNSVSNR